MILFLGICTQLAGAAFQKQSLPTQPSPGAQRQDARLPRPSLVLPDSEVALHPALHTCSRPVRPLSGTTRNLAHSLGRRVAGARTCACGPPEAWAVPTRKEAGPLRHLLFQGVGVTRFPDR